jgi:microcompartment protein CcmL/EutN
MAPADGDLLGVRLPRSEEVPPGRGVLVVRGRLAPVQVAITSL